MMKKWCVFLLALLMLIGLNTALCENAPEELFGQWNSYATLFGTVEEVQNFLAFGANKDIVSTRAGERWPTGFAIYEDGTLDVTEKGTAYPGSWEWDEQNGTIKINDGVNTLPFLLEEGFMTCGIEKNGYATVMVYYRPDLLTIDPASYAGKAWKLLNIVDNHEKISAYDTQNDYQFTLHEDGAASLLVHYQPLESTWSVDGFKLIVNNPRGSVLILEPQLDGSLFGTYEMPDGGVMQVEFGETEAFDFIAQPLPLKDLEGTWEMVGMEKMLMGGDVALPYDMKQLDFTYRLEVSQSGVTLYHESQRANEVIPLTAGTVGGPLTGEKDASGTVLVGVPEDGYEMIFWLLKDGTLKWKNPGAFNLYFQRK